MVIRGIFADVESMLDDFNSYATSFGSWLVRWMEREVVSGLAFSFGFDSDNWRFFPFVVTFGRAISLPTL
jgi:hypothetical protein